MIGEDLARIRGLGNREWMALQDRVQLVVHPDRDPDEDNGWVYGFARLYSVSPGNPPPHPAVAPEQQCWTELEEGDFSYPGCSTSRCTSCVSARVVRRSANRSPAARQARVPFPARRHRFGMVSHGLSRSSDVRPLS